MDLQGPVLPIAFLACFLDSQLDAPAAARLTLSACSEVSQCLSRLIHATLRYHIGTGGSEAEARDALRAAALRSPLGCTYPLPFERAGGAARDKEALWFERSYVDATDESISHLLGSNLMLAPVGVILDTDTGLPAADSALSNPMDLSDPSRRAYCATAQRSLDVLEAVRKRLLARDLVQANQTESAEVSIWQLLLLLLASAYLAVAENIERDMQARAAELTQALSSGRLVTEQQKLADAEHAESCFQVALLTMLRFWSG